MAGAKRVGWLAAGVALWAGLCLPGLQNPSADEHQADAPRAWAAASEGQSRGRADSSRRGEADEICSQVQQPTAILFVAPLGKTVKKGDLLAELDIAALTDERVRQVLQTRKAEGEVVMAQELEAREKRAASEQIAIAGMALRLAQSQLKAFTEGEYPQQSGLAQDAAAIARQKLALIQNRVTRVRAAVKEDNEPEAIATLQETEIQLAEAKMESTEADGALALLQSFTHDNRVAELELAVAERKFDLARARDALSVVTVRTNVQRSLAETSRRMESDRLARLDDQIGKSRIYAPRDGTILYPNEPNEAPIHPGTVVRAQQVLLHLLPAALSGP
jgi:HlyD family secretion protein